MGIKREDLEAQAELLKKLKNRESILRRLEQTFLSTYVTIVLGRDTSIKYSNDDSRAIKDFLLSYEKEQIKKIEEKLGFCHG